MEPAVGPLEQEIPSIAELVGQAGADHAASQERARLDPRNDQRQSRVREVGLVAGPALHDVTGELALAQGRLQLPAQCPPACADPTREAEADEHLQAPELLASLRQAPPVPEERACVAHVTLRIGPREQPAVELRELRALHHARAAGQDLVVRPEAEHPRGKLLAAIPDAPLDVARIDREGAAVIVSASNQEMDVGVVGVVVVDRDPLEPGAEVVLHLAHEGAGMEAEIELRPLLGRDDGFPEAGVARRMPGTERRGEVKVVPARGEAEPSLAGPLGAIPREIRTVGPPGANAPVANIGDFDDALSPVRPHADDDAGAAGAVARGELTPAAKPGPPGRAPRRTVMPRGRYPPDVEAEGVGVTHGS